MKRIHKKKIIKYKKPNTIKNKNIIYNNINKKIDPPSQHKKINNIINNNSITIISHYDIEENSINKKKLENNNKFISGNYHKKGNIDKIDSNEKDIIKYIEENCNINSNKIIKQKIDELNCEINKYKEERNNANKIKKQYEKLNSQLIADIEILNRQKEEFENYKIKEMEKIRSQREKNLSDNKLVKNLKNENELLNKKLQKYKEIIDSLKIKMSKYQNKNSLQEKINKNRKNMIDEIDFLNNKNKQKINRNKSEIAIKYENNKDNKISNITKKRSDNSIKDTYNTIKNNKSNNKNSYVMKQENYYDKSNSNKKNEIKIITEVNFAHKNKTYEDQFQLDSLKNKVNNFKNNLQFQKNSDLNILTQEQYDDIISLINDSSYSINKTDITSSPKRLKSNEINIKEDMMRGSGRKKVICKSKSNIDLKNNNNSKYQFRYLAQKKCNKKNNSDDISKNELKDLKEQLLIEDKLTLEEYDFKIPEKYKNKKYTLIKTVENDEKKINIYNDDKREIFFPSGVRKEIFNDGYQIVHFVNGDIKQNFPDGKSVYYFNEAKTVQTTFNNGVLVFKFGNNQLERHYPDGKKQILFPDGSERLILSNGYEETHYKDGSVVKSNVNGKTITESSK